MLVLTRKPDEGIQIGNDITIKVLHARRGKVQLGIEAPEHVRILRSEHLTRQRIQRTIDFSSIAVGESLPVIIAPEVECNV